jgi:heptosyltransferase-2
VPEKQNSILVIRGGAIGDFILTLPAIAALRRQFPRSRLEVIGYQHIVQLAIAGGLVDRVRSIEARAMAGFFARGGTLDPDLSHYFGSFALIVSYLFDPDVIFQTNVARVSTAQFLPCPHRPDEKLGTHATDVFLKPLERLAIFDADPSPRLTLNSQSSTLNQLALHPGSGSERKNWPEARWAELIELLLAETNFHVLLVGGEAEGDRLQRLIAALPPARAQLAMHLPLPELAARLTQCAAFIGHDSGITHLAAAVGLPVLVLWAGASEVVWCPRSERAHVLRHPAGLSSLEPSTVLRRLREVAI